MSRRLVLGLALLGASMFLPSIGSAAPQKVKLKSTSVKFLSDAPMEKIQGTATATGDLAIDLADLNTIRGRIAVPVGSMRTGNAKRDGHLRGKDWLDAKSHPEIQFDIKKVKVTGAPAVNAKGIGKASVIATGSFTLHGVAKKISVPVSLKWKKGKGIKIATSFKISLADYKIAGRGSIVGEKVGKTIDIDARMKGKLQ